MLYTDKLLAELRGARDRLASYEDAHAGRLQAYRGALVSLARRYPSSDAVAEAQSALKPATQGRGAVSLGAAPTTEYDAWVASGADLPRLPFGRDFAHHEEARAWAEHLRGWTTIAVDGSQLLPWKDASVPLALVQAGLFENPHEPPAPYVKDVETELLLPDDLVSEDDTAEDARAGELIGYSTQVVHLRRFELEARTLAERMRFHAAQGRAGRTVALCDGSLIVSFAVKMQPAYRDRYVQAARLLLRASEEYRVPLVGYIDTSYARDVVTMLQSLAGDDPLPSSRGVHDAMLWRHSLDWGDRTPAFISARDDLKSMRYAEQSDEVAFVYLQAAMDRPPVRLEFPRWLLEGGTLNSILDVVRAEIIAGAGYPYSIEAADAVAVISTQDRAQFYRLFQQFAEREGLGFSFSRKALSKTRRRV